VAELLPKLRAHRGAKPICGLAAAACAAIAAGTGPAGAAAPELYWSSAPPSGGHVLLDSGRSRTLRLAATARDRKQQVRVSLLGKTSVRLVTRAGNPAIATLQFPFPRTFEPRTFVVTLVAKTRRHRVARTLIVEVRTTTVSLVGPGSRSRWAYVAHPSPARARPSSSARSIGAVSATTSDATPNLVRLLAVSRPAGGKQWVKVSLTDLPNGRAGWIPRNALSQFHVVTTHVVVDRSRLTLTLYRAGRQALRVPVAVGRSQWPTPRGTFYIRDRMTHFDNPFYGPIAFGMNARSPTLTDWPGGGIVGIHGTNEPGLIPGRVSHGCIRLRNEDIRRLARQLPLGTPVVIR
jgi:lipoprotein-anchoring transpeptidase ErfK/SrfK